MHLDRWLRLFLRRTSLAWRIQQDTANLLGKSWSRWLSSTSRPGKLRKRPRQCWAGKSLQNKACMTPRH